MFCTPPESSQERPSGWSTVTLKVVSDGTSNPARVFRELKYCPSTDTNDRAVGPGRLILAFAI